MSVPRTMPSNNGIATRQPAKIPTLQRVTFRTSREMDFFSEKELVTQTGHAVYEWPLVIVKELIDNSLDACEEADIAPQIEVVADAAGISVKDNGPGLPEATLRGALDFTVRASSREAYVSPCRGAQGNALKTIFPMPRVLDPEAGALIVVSQGKRHAIRCGADPISGRAVVHDDVTTERKATGTLVRMEWSPRAKGNAVVWPFGHESDVYEYCLDARRCYEDDVRTLVEGFAVFNPHLTMRLRCFGQETVWKATEPSWAKWKPSHPTSAHWYEPAHLERLIGAYITHDRETETERLVRDFIAEFDGLSGSLKRSRVLADADMHRVGLQHLVTDGQLDTERIGCLLAAMQRHTRPVNPKRLGILGEDHLKRRLLEMGIKPESFRYSKKLSPAKSKNLQSREDEKACFEELPGVLESAFGWRGKDAANQRKICTGANWSAAIKNPFRSFGSTGEGLETELAKLRATDDEPIVFVLHLAQPRVQYTDRGKAALVIGGEQ